MLKLRYLYQILASVEICAPLRHERIDWNVLGWWSFYEFTLEVGFRFPMPKLLRGVIFHFEIAPSQLMTNSWKILMSLKCLSMRSGIEFDLCEVLYTYFLGEHKCENGRYNLYVSHREQLVHHLKTND